MATSKAGELPPHAPAVDTEVTWIDENFYKRRCIKFVQDEKNTSKCMCGRLRSVHPNVTEGILRTTYPVSEKWSFTSHTELSPTDAYGTIEFQGGPHPTKAQYVRLSFDTKPERILQLLHQHWGLDIPKLLISVHGGIANFDLQPKLRRVCKQGLFSAAKTTGAWVTTGGTNTGVMRHVGDALGDTLVQYRHNIITIGIAPWGVVHKREDLIGKNIVVPYHAISLPGSDNIVLNSSHSYFLLVDDGSVGRFGCETVLRKNLEKFISQQRIVTRSGYKDHGTPVVCLLIEGGSNCIRTVLECVTDHQPIPVVIIDGSGRASDLLAFTHKYAQPDGTMPEVLKDQLLTTVAKTFRYGPVACERVYTELVLSTKKRNLITVFRIGEDAQDIDQAILTALLKSSTASSLYQLNLTMAWNRVDMARSHIFAYGHLWPEGALDQAMMDALVSDRVDFVKLLIENGVNMTKWLTIKRLEDLYNHVLNTPRPTQVKRVQFASARAKPDSGSTLRHLLMEHKSSLPRYTLYEIGQVMNELMGGAYQSFYCRRKFRLLHHASKNKGNRNSSAIEESDCMLSTGFKYPYSDLMIWAVLLRRHKMAMFMWERGEESLAKCLMAAKLYKSMIKEAEEDEYEIDVANEIGRCHQEFFNKASELLDYCYKTDEDLTQLLLTYELNNWGNQTCLSLAVAGSNRSFIAHTCCQILLTEMWMGGLRMRKYPSLKVILGIWFFPLILFFNYRTREELQMMPQTQEEHTQYYSDVDSIEGDSDDSDIEPSYLPPTSALPSVTVTVDLSPVLTIDEGATTKNANSQSESNLLQKQNSVGRTTKPRNMQHVSPLERSMSKRMTRSKTEIIANKESMDNVKVQNSQLHIGQKIFEFYTAPISKFWLHTMGYCIFMVIFIYMMLIATPVWPSGFEWYISSYMVGLLFEKIREFLTSEPTKVRQKMRVILSDGWNIVDIVSLTLYAIGFILRFNPGLIGHARAFYCLTVAICITKIVEYFVISPHLGPFVHILGKMIREFLYLMAFVLVSIIAFGTFRLSVWFPDGDFDWASVREIFLKPYFMLYGEVFHEIIWPDCNVNSTGTLSDTDFKCVPGRWMVPIALTIFLAFGIIVLLSLVIAVFNNVFVKAYTRSNVVWKFQRYLLVIEYESRPLLPSPFIIISHIILLVKFLIGKCLKRHKKFDQGLKVFLHDNDLEKLHDFEEECMEIYHREKQQSAMVTNDFTIRQTAEGLEKVSNRLDDIQQRENSISQYLLMMQIHLNKIEELTVANNTAFWSLQQQLQQPRDASNSSNNNQPFQSYVPTTSEACLLSSLKKSNELSLSHSAISSSGETEGGDVSSCMTDGSVATNALRQRRGGVVKSSIISTEPQRVRSSSMTAYQRTIDDKPSFIHPSMRYSSCHSYNRFQQPHFSQRLDSRHYIRTISENESIDMNMDDNFPTPLLSSYNLSLKNPYNLPSSVGGVRKYQCIPLTPIVTPMRVEYTSITDEIDTSFLINATNSSPPDTPPPYPPSFINPPKHRKHKKKKGLKVPCINIECVQESNRLKEAEETVSEQLKKVVKRRIRQLSLTEPDNEFCNLAMNALEKFEILDDDSEYLDDSIDDEHSYKRRGEDDSRISTSRSHDEIIDASVGKSSTKLKFVQSEPSLRPPDLGMIEMSRLLTLREDDEEDGSGTSQRRSGSGNDTSIGENDVLSFRVSSKDKLTGNTQC